MEMLQMNLFLALDLMVALMCWRGLLEVDQMALHWAPYWTPLKVGMCRVVKVALMFLMCWMVADAIQIISRLN
ncbi:hypothetical protein D3C81_1828840 [compost metagenome]